MFWLKDARVSASIGCFLLSLLILFAGSVLGLDSLVSRLVTVLAILVVLVVLILVLTLKGQRNAGSFEEEIKRNADAAVVGVDASQRAAVAELRRGLLAALETLKKSRIGRKSGKSALYELPWYLVIGHPSAGKSSAILNSGLNFPFADKDKSIIRGLGGTRNCDWFFTTEAVILDTAGRYATEKGDRAEWVEFLRLLKKHRPHAPVNGIVVAVSLVEILNHRGEVSEKYAHQIRERINEVEQVFRMRIPIYLTFTKVDLVGGFSGFFSDFQEAQRHQVWGATFTHAQSADFNVGKNIEAQFALLCKGVERLGMDRLASHGHNVSRAELFTFPLEFADMSERLNTFVGHLFAHDPYHNIPFIRGCYFTSALQNGGADVVAGRHIASEYALTGPGFNVPADHESRPYFLRDFFRKVLFNDQHLVWRQTKSLTGNLRWGLAAVGAITLSLASGLWLWSYQNNLEMVAPINALIEQSEPATTAERMAYLQAIHQQRLALQQRHEQGVPLRFRMGLYTGYEALSQLDTLYFERMNLWVVQPLQSGIEQRLLSAVTRLVQARSDQSPAPELYDALKSYMLLNRQKIDERSFVDSQLRLVSKTMAGYGESTDLVHQHYLDEFDLEAMPKLALNKELVEQAQRLYVQTIASKTGAERAYIDMIARANQKFGSVTVESVVGKENAAWITGTHTVDGAFTADAYDQFVKMFFNSSSQQDGADSDWVLGDAGKSQSNSLSETELTQLREIYLKNYAQHWVSWLQGIRVGGSEDANAKLVLNLYADAKTSPVELVVKRVLRETELFTTTNNLPMPNGAVVDESLINKTKQLLTLSEKQNKILSAAESAARKTSTTDSENNQSTDLMLLAQLKAVWSTPTAAAYATNISALNDTYDAYVTNGKSEATARKLVTETFGAGVTPFKSAMASAKDLVRPLDSSVAVPLEALLTYPVKTSYSSLLSPVVGEINSAWKKEVFTEWKNHATRFPFSDADNEIPVPELNRIFNVESGILAKFAKKNLSDVASIRNGRIQPHYWEGMGIPLDKTFVRTYDQVNNVGEVALGDSLDALLEIQISATRGVKESVIELDGDVVRYRNGPQYWKALSWPKENVNSGIKVNVITYDGKTISVANIPGRMSLIRLLADPRATRIDATTVRIDIPVPEIGGEKLSFQLRMVQGMNPFVLTQLRGLKLPAKVTS